MDKFLDKFADFPAKYKYLILAGIVLISVGLFYWLVYTDKKAKIDALEQELQTLQVELQKAEAFAARYDEFKEELRLVDLKLKDALKKLPVQDEIPNLLDQINESVLNAGLSFSLFQPQGEQPMEFYSEVPVQISVSGGYHNFAKFADAISKMERIVTLRNMTLSPKEVTGELNISCQAVTFKQAESPEN
ncbi:MAG: type 4a pilus biogenesis protein PilO [Candidatus Vecturithrix sp.]|jgi:type IV pilus assembly protein PilO|nr:type 4a pilus biogenesis protein PilO [Candidatus Vecturithrix sp.]